MDRFGSWRLVLGIAAFGLACAAAAGPLDAQELAPGALVRVDAPDLPRRVVATVMSRTYDAITIAVPVRSVRADGAPFSLHRVSLSNVRRVEVSRGESHRKGAWRGFGTGALLGTALSTAVFLNIDKHSGEGGETVVAGALLLPPAVGILGSALGFLVGVEDWHRVSP
jgi:hypothetical protein